MMFKYPETGLCIWDDTLPPAAGVRGIYIAVSGNTAAGKSSLVSAVEQASRASHMPVVGIGERSLHHPLLRLMFSAPREFAFPIQLNFLLQRYLVLRRNLSLGRNIIIERSHLDDQLFVDEHADSGQITSEQLIIYRKLAEMLHFDLPTPDILVLLNPSPELSCRRLRNAEEAGERPREFPDEQSKEQWVRRWHRLYTQLHDNFRELCRTSPQYANTKVLEPPSEMNLDVLARNIIVEIEKRRGEYDNC